jgi:Nif-specific regulatory protein
MPLSLQAKMLRVLQEKQFERIGGSKTFTVDVRIVAATNVSLEQAVANGQFRADLYYRLNVVPIILPPLRDRKEDIPLLFSHFLNKSNERNGREIKITSELLDFFINYSWPGNVREMQNLVERMVILAEGDRLSLGDLPPNLFSLEKMKQEKSQEVVNKVENRQPTFTRKSLQDIERTEIEAALRRNGWVQVRAARELGLTERQIGYRIKKYQLNRYESFR